MIGYVSRVSADDLKAEGDAADDPLLHHPGFRIGKQGVEKSLDLQLRGRAGGRKVEVDSVGRVIREDPDGDIRAQPGDVVKLTLDADIQNRALEVFGEDSGAAVMMDCRSGDVPVHGVGPELRRQRLRQGRGWQDLRATGPV